MPDAPQNPPENVPDPPSPGSPDLPPPTGPAYPSGPYPAAPAPGGPDAGGQYPGGQYPGGQYPGGPSGPVGKPGVNGFAIASLVFGIIGGIVLSLIFGIIALVQIGRSGQRGRGMAIAGLVLTAVWALLIAAAVVVALNTDSAPTSSSTSGTSPTPSASPSPATIAVGDLGVGDCVNGLADSQTFEELPLVDCSRPHQAEVYAVVNLSGSAYPGSKTISTAAQTRCVNKLRQVAPKAFRDRAVKIFWLQPTKLNWTRGDRSITCFALTDTARSGSVLD